MFSKLLNILHKYPMSSIGLLFAAGMVLIFFNMIYLSNTINRKLTTKYVETYINSLDTVQSIYSSEIVARLQNTGIRLSKDYRTQEGSIPFPATFSIELAKAMSNHKTGIINKLYSDYPFSYRKVHWPRDEYSKLALKTFQLAKDKNKPFIRFEAVNNRMSIRYSKALVMKESCVECHTLTPIVSKKTGKLEM